MNRLERAATVAVMLGSCLPAGCATAPVAGDAQPSPFSLQQLEIPSIVSSPYQATFHCVGLESVDILMGHFYWDDEGPFEYPVSGMDQSEGKVRFRLHTGNPATYDISGYLSYKDKATGKNGLSARISAGTITVQP